MPRNWCWFNLTPDPHHWIRDLERQLRGVLSSQ